MPRKDPPSRRAHRRRLHRRWRHADLGYPEERVLLEYQGDEHRTSRRRWLSDLTRTQLLDDAGYRTILVGDADLVPMTDGDDQSPLRCPALAARVRRARDRANGA